MRQLCHAAPGRVAAIAVTSPRWTSEVTSFTPVRPWATRSLFLQQPGRVDTGRDGHRDAPFESALEGSLEGSPGGRHCTYSDTLTRSRTPLCWTPLAPCRVLGPRELLSNKALREAACVTYVLQQVTVGSVLKKRCSTTTRTPRSMRTGTRSSPRCGTDRRCRPVRARHR